MGWFDRLRRRGRRRPRRVGGGSGAERAVAEQAFERGKDAYFDREDYRQAAAEFRRAAELTPDSVDSHCLLGASLVQLGDNDGAIAPLRTCLELAPDHDVANYVLGVALGRLDRFDECGTYLVKAAQLGNEPARELLPQIGVDYCRKCGRPVRKSGPVEADIVLRSPPFGAKCPGCGIVICWGCFLANGAMSQAWTQLPPCPNCGTPVLPFET